MWAQRDDGIMCFRQISCCGLSSSLCHSIYWAARPKALSRVRDKERLPDSQLKSREILALHVCPVCRTQTPACPPAVHSGSHSSFILHSSVVVRTPVERRRHTLGSRCQFITPSLLFVHPLVRRSCSYFSNTSASRSHRPLQMLICNFFIQTVTQDNGLYSRIDPVWSFYTIALSNTVLKRKCKTPFS